jgi:hypothetical protein
LSPQAKDVSCVVKRYIFNGTEIGVADPHSLVNVGEFILGLVGFIIDIELKG